MGQEQRLRGLMAGMGALAGLALYLWGEIAQTDWLAERALLIGIGWTAVFFAALLALAPRVDLRKAALLAAGLAAAVSALVWAASWRYDGVSGLADAGYPVLAAFTLAILPLPFLIAGSVGSWRDYAALFDQSWGIVLRAFVAVILALSVWALILLSDQLLALVGLEFFDILLDLMPAPYLITGAAVGLGIAVSAENLAPKGAGLALMLLRLLLPPMVAVVALFLLALPLRGLSGLFGNLSAGMTLMAMLAVAATLVTSVVDTDGQAASRAKILGLSARIMGGMMALLGGLALLAVALRVEQYGWTPARVYGALAAVIGLGYGAFYAAAALRADWMARVRRANITMALAQIGLAALALTPLLNAERISANSQVARLVDGRTAVQALDVDALQAWGRAGAAALANLKEQSQQPGEEALAQRLAQPSGLSPQTDAEVTDLRRALAASLPVQPKLIPATRDAFLERIDDYLLSEIVQACAMDLGQNMRGCVMVVGDFLPLAAGDEAVLAWIDGGETLILHPLRADTSGTAWHMMHVFGPVQPIAGDSAREALRNWQSAPPQLTPAPINQLPLNGGGAMVLP